MASPSSTMTSIQSGNLKFDAPGRPRAMSKRKAGPSFGSLPHLRSLRMQARRAGPTAASFSSHVAQGFSLHLIPRSAPASTGPFPRLASATWSLLARMAALATGPPRGGILVMLDRAIRGGTMRPSDRNVEAPQQDTYRSIASGNHSQPGWIAGWGRGVCSRLYQVNPAIGFNPARTKNGNPSSFLCRIWRRRSNSTSHHSTVACLPDLSMDSTVLRVVHKSMPC